jgi:hypothetical protein
MLQPHLFQVYPQLFGDQHRDGRIGALAHLDIGHGQDNLPIALDADKGVGREAVIAGRFGMAVCDRQAQAQHQASARGRPGLQEPASGEVVTWDHRQPPRPLDCAACLIASRIRT